MAQTIKLTGARVAVNATRSERVDLAIPGQRDVDLSGYLVLPGLINAHDHLEFNLFQRMGCGPYPNASAWAADIYHPSESPLKEHLRVPKADRLIWGGIKNLLSGVTTVAHHNPFEPDVFNRDFPVRVVTSYGWSHSLDFSPDLAHDYQRTPDSWPFIVHAAEGTDARARAEVARLKELGVLSPRTVLVHAVGAETEVIRESGSAIVWCPSSNLFTLGQTLSSKTVRSGVPVALGTDSALTGDGDLIDEMRCAKRQCRLEDDEIYALVTTNAARVLRLRKRAGDLIAVADKGQTPAAALIDLHPELIIVGGRVMLMSDDFAGLHPMEGFHRIHLEGRGSWLIRADVPRLYRAAVEALGPEIRLAGRRVCP